MPTGLFDALDHDWSVLIRSRQARLALSRWSTEPALGDFTSLEALLDRLRHGGTDPDGTDEILGALVRLAALEELAARIVLQAMLPGLFNVAKRLGRGHVDDELEADVLAEAAIRIRTYPIKRRPRAIAANITWDVFGGITRRRRAAARPAVEHLEVNEDPDPSREVYELVSDAVETGKLLEVDGQLLLAIAVGVDTIGGRAAREGISYGAMNERWRRARNRLRLAIAA